MVGGHPSVGGVKPKRRLSVFDKFLQGRWHIRPLDQVYGSPGINKPPAGSKGPTGEDSVAVAVRLRDFGSQLLRQSEGGNLRCLRSVFARQIRKPYRVPIC